MNSEDMIQMVSVTDLLQNLTGSVDGFGTNWYDMIYAKSLDMSFWALCDLIPVHGFLDPICVVVGVSPEGKTLVQGNGHHRLTAAILLGLDEVPVLFSFTGDYMRCGDTDKHEHLIGQARIDWREVDEMHAVLWGYEYEPQD